MYSKICPCPRALRCLPCDGCLIRERRERETETKIPFPRIAAPCMRHGPWQERRLSITVALNTRLFRAWCASTHTDLEGCLALSKFSPSCLGAELSLSSLGAELQTLTGAWLSSFRSSLCGSCASLPSALQASRRCPTISRM